MTGMKIFVNLLVVSVLFSSCLAETLTKSTLLKLCETGRAVRNLGLNNDEIVSVMKSTLKSNINQLGLASNLKQNCKLELSMSNSGIIQAMIMPKYLEDLNGELLKSFRSSIFNFEPAIDSSSDPITASKVVSSMTFDYCEYIDFPESIDIEDKVATQKSVIKIVSSMLKQHKKATQLIEDYLSTVDKQLLTE